MLAQMEVPVFARAQMIESVKKSFLGRFRLAKVDIPP